MKESPSFNQDDNDPIMEVIDSYMPMIAKHWKRCNTNGTFSFDEMVSEVYLRARKSNVTMDRGKKQVTLYMSKICYTLSTAVLKYNTYDAKILGVGLDGCRSKTMEGLGEKVHGLNEPARRNVGHVDNSKREGSTGVSKKKTSYSRHDGSSPVFGGKSQGLPSDDLDLMIDMREKLSSTEHEVARLVISGCNVSEVARRMDMHPWSLRTIHFPKIAQKLKLKRD